MQHFKLSQSCYEMDIKEREILSAVTASDSASFVALPRVSEIAMRTAAALEAYMGSRNSLYRGGTPQARPCHVRLE